MKTLRLEKRIRALTMSELLVIVAVLMLLAAMLLPTPRGDRPLATRISCVNNLKQIGLAFRIWAGDNEDKYPMQVSTNADGAAEFGYGRSTYRVFQVMSNDLNTPKILYCPSESDRLRKMASTFADTVSPQASRQIPFASNSNLSYFVGVDATETNANMLLSGDRNLTNGLPLRDGLLALTTNRLAGWTSEMHENVGNVLIGDGSVQEFSTPGLRAAIACTGVNTNRLAMPGL